MTIVAATGWATFERSYFPATVGVAAIPTPVVTQAAYDAVIGSLGTVVPDGGGMFRLQLGPYRTQEEARSIADRIQAELGLRPVIVGR